MTVPANRAAVETLRAVYGEHRCFFSQEYATGGVLGADVDFAVPARRLFVGTGGDVTVRLLGDSADTTFKNLVDGAVLDNLTISRIVAAATSAYRLVVMW